MTSRFKDHLLGGTHAARPAANTVPAGATYSCTTHNLEYQSDGTTTWTTRSTFGGGGAASPSYLGTNSVGGSYENMTLARQYAKKVTAGAAGVLHSVQAYLNQAADSSFTIKGLAWADNAGTPGIVLAASYATDFVIGTPGWRAFPLGIEVAASTSYWIGLVVSARPIGSGNLQLAYAAGGSDRYQQSGTAAQIGDWTSGWGPTTTANNYSIRGLIS